jgi:hypothetical protein
VHVIVAHGSPPGEARPAANSGLTYTIRALRRRCTIHAKLTGAFGVGSE